jgi:hypothetical protein
MMRGTDILRSILDLLDQIEVKQPTVDIEINKNHEPDDRFRQILAMLDANSFGPLANSPNEVVAPISSVTTDAGGGVNAPKHPADIRVKDPGYGHGG